MTAKKFTARAKELVRTFSVRNSDCHVIDPHSKASLALLEQFYNDVYVPAFPIDEERESLETWLKNLKDPESGIVIVVSGDNLAAAKNVVPKAISVAYAYIGQDPVAGLMAYNAVHPDFQGQGLGRTMVEARMGALLEIAQRNNKKLGGVFIECNDPAKVSAEDDVMDPALRIRMFEKMGAIVLPVTYVQPPLEVGADKCDTLKLLAYANPETGKYPTVAEIKGYLNGIYTELEEYAGCPPEKNPDYIKSMRELDALGDAGLAKFIQAELKSRQEATARNSGSVASKKPSSSSGISPTNPGGVLS